jgi:hypothetical protein
VIQTNSTPIIDTAIARKNQDAKIGGGLVSAPIECFKALVSLASMPKRVIEFGIAYNNSSCRRNRGTMASGYIVRKNEYYDSVFLMRIAQILNDEPGVQQSLVLMATQANKTILAEADIGS